MDATKLALSRRLVTHFALSALVFITLSGCASTGAAQSSPQSSAISSSPAQTAETSSAQTAAASASGAAAQPTASPSPMAAPVPVQEHLIGVGSATVITVHGTVVSVKRAKKLVTLQGPSGKRVTLHVYNPYNLAAAKAGEPFVAKFYEIVTVRKKKAGESLPAASLVEGVASAQPGQTPGAAVGSRVQLVVTVDAINSDKGTVDVKGPDGKLETVSVVNPADLKQLKAGEQIVITLTNVVAIALEKESGA